MKIYFSTKKIDSLIISLLKKIKTDAALPGEVIVHNGRQPGSARKAKTKKKIINCSAQVTSPASSSRGISLNYRRRFSQFSPGETSARKSAFFHPVHFPERARSFFFSFRFIRPFFFRHVRFSHFRVWCDFVIVPFCPPQMGQTVYKNVSK